MRFNLRLADTLFGGMDDVGGESAFPTIRWVVTTDMSSAGIDTVVCGYRFRKWIHVSADSSSGDISNIDGEAGCVRIRCIVTR